MKEKIIFILNPISGIGKNKKVPHLIKKFLNTSIFDYTICYTQHRGHAVEIATEAIRDGYSIIAVVGGDGTINEVGSALVDTTATLAIIPTGSGNGIARHLNIPLKLKEAILHINRLNKKPIDTFRLNNKIGVGFSGFGFDAFIAQKFEEASSRGLFTYAKLILKEFLRYKPFSIRLNGEEYSNLFFCTIANTSQFGNGFQISPLSKIDDTQLEIVLIKRPNFWGILNLALSSRFGTIHQSKHVEIIPLPYGQLQLENSLGHIDGDPINFDYPSIDIQVVPKSLNVLV